MDAMTALELHDVNDRQGLSGLGNMGCCSQAPVSGLSGYFSDAWDCLLSPVQCTKAAFGSEAESTAAWHAMKQPDVPFTQASVPQGPARPFEVPTGCPPQLKSACQPPGVFNDYSCLCEVAKIPTNPSAPITCQPPNVFDPVNKICHRTSDGPAGGQPWYKQTPVMIALGLGVVALALSLRRPRV